MKKIILFVTALIMVTGINAFAGETFHLTTPVTVSNQATDGEITSYSIVPADAGGQPRFVINFRWIDTNGDEVGVPQAVT